MQEDTGSVTQKYAYNGTLSRYLASLMLEKDSQGALATTSEEEVFVSSPTTEAEEDAFLITDDMIENMPSVITDEHASNAAQQNEELEPVTTAAPELEPATMTAQEQQILP